jgi:hypothetical protein
MWSAGINRSNDYQTRTELTKSCALEGEEPGSLMEWTCEDKSLDYRVQNKRNFHMVFIIFKMLSDAKIPLVLINARWVQKSFSETD